MGGASSQGFFVSEPLLPLLKGGDGMLSRIPSPTPARVRVVVISLINPRMVAVTRVGTLGLLDVHYQRCLKPRFELGLMRYPSFARGASRF